MTNGFSIGDFVRDKDENIFKIVAKDDILLFMNIKTNKFRLSIKNPQKIILKIEKRI